MPPPPGGRWLVGPPPAGLMLGQIWGHARTKKKKNGKGAIEGALLRRRTTFDSRVIRRFLKRCIGKDDLCLFQNAFDGLW